MDFDFLTDFCSLGEMPDVVIRVRLQDWDGEHGSVLGCIAYFQQCQCLTWCYREGRLDHAAIPRRYILVVWLTSWYHFRSGRLSFRMYFWTR